MTTIDMLKIVEDEIKAICIKESVEIFSTVKTGKYKFSKNGFSFIVDSTKVEHMLSEMTQPMLGSLLYCIINRDKNALEIKNI